MKRTINGAIFGPWPWTGVVGQNDLALNRSFEGFFKQQNKNDLLNHCIFTISAYKSNVFKIKLLYTR